LRNKKDVADEDYIQQLLWQYKQLSVLSIALPNAPIIFAIDYSKRKYLFFSNSLGSYPVQDILDGGLDFTIPLMPNDFYNTYNEKVFSAVLSFFKLIPQAEHVDYIVSCNHRIKNSNNKNIDFLQRSTYITSKETGLPLYCVGMALDISHFKNDNAIFLSFEKTNKETGVSTLVETKSFYPCQEEGLLTEQEKTILLYLADGLTTKMIADKLNISYNTIRNHCTNMLRKTNSKNTVELIMFSVRNKIL
jgi:DNA-binding CsgD family transcriptional regulator